MRPASLSETSRSHGLGEFAQWRVGRSTGAEPPNRDAKLLCLVGEVVLNPGTREMQHADRQYFEHRVVASEWRGLGMLRPVGLKSYLRHLAVVVGGDQLGALGRATVQQHHVGVLGVDRSSLAQISR